MHAKLERLSAVRARHAKRPLNLEQRADDSAGTVTGSGFTLTGPLTFTVTNTKSVDAATTPSDTPASSPTSISSATSSSAAIVSSSSLVPIPIASVLTSKNSNASTPLETSGALASEESPLNGGAIAAIVVALLVVFAVVIAFFTRRLLAQKRKLQRASFWKSKGFNPSEPTYGEKPNEPEATPFVSQTNGRPGDVSPGYVFAHAQAHSIASQVEPPKAPQMSYNNPIGTSANSALAPGEIAPTIPYLPVTRATSGGSDDALAVSRVQYAFIPTLPDELSISTGEMVSIVAKYDDGWALCENRAGDKGMVPLECLEDLGKSFDGQNSNQRESSLVASRF